jgi:hypothetical protein
MPFRQTIADPSDVLNAAHLGEKRLFRYSAEVRSQCNAPYAAIA